MKKKKKKEKKAWDVRKYLMQGLVREGFRLVEIGIVLASGALFGIKLTIN